MRPIEVPTCNSSRPGSMPPSPGEATPPRSLRQLGDRTPYPLRPQSTVCARDGAGWIARRDALRHKELSDRLHAHPRPAESGSVTAEVTLDPGAPHRNPLGANRLPHRYRKVTG